MLIVHDSGKGQRLAGRGVQWIVGIIVTDEKLSQLAGFS